MSRSKQCHKDGTEKSTVSTIAVQALYDYYMNMTMHESLHRRL